MTNIPTAPYATVTDIIAAIEELELLDGKKNAIIANALAGMWFTVGAELDPETMPLGLSRIGGDPDLPQGYNWPTTKAGEPLAFLFQLDLSPIGGSFIGVFCGPDEPATDVQHHIVYAETNELLVRVTPPPGIERPHFDDHADDTTYQGYFATPRQLIGYHGLDLPRWSSTNWEVIVADGPDTEEVYEELQMAVDVPNAIIRAGGHRAGVGFDPAEDACTAQGMPVEHVNDWQHLVTLYSQGEICIWDAGYFQVLVNDADGTRQTYASVETS